MLHEIMLLSHRYLLICHFVCFSRNCINLFLLNLLHKVLLDFQRVLEYQHHWKNISISIAVFCSCFLKRVSLMCSKIRVWSVISLSSTTSFLFYFEILVLFLNSKKHCQCFGVFLWVNLLLIFNSKSVF